MLRINLIIIFLLLLASTVFAQVNEENLPSVEDIIEQMQASSESDNIDFTSLLEDLTFFVQNPINLNDATEEELGKLQFLTDFEVKSILFYIKKSGVMYSVYELQMVYGLTTDKIQMLLPFVCASPKAGDKQFPIMKAFTKGKHQVFGRVEQVFEKQKGFSAITDSALLASPNSRYLGSSQKVYFKYKYNYRKKIFWGLTADKDPGEEFFKGTQKQGFDFYSAHLQINDIKLYKDVVAFKTVCLGDYELQFGQGLTMWSGMASGKSSSVINIKKRGYGLKRYSSSDENLFKRGAATTVRIKDIDITGFYSHKNIDANITAVDSSDGEATEISSLQISGIHSNPSEIADRHAISESVYGSNVSFNQENFKLGLTYIHYAFGAPLISSIRPYNMFDFRGTENSNLGIDYQFVFKDIHFFGEAARSENGGIAYINGMQVKMATQLAFSLVHRNYDRDYQAYYAKPFSESGKAANEEGIYVGAELSPHKKIKISGYYDMYKFPWLKSTSDAPSNGTDYLVELNYFVSRNVSMSARFKHEVKPTNVSGQTADVTKLELVDNKKFRYQISYTLAPNLRMKNRFDLVEYKRGDSATLHGFMIYQDLIYSFNRIPLSLATRYGIFDTDSYDTRIYTYETDVLYGYSIPALYDKGARVYLMLKYSFLKNLDVWFRVAQTYYANKTVIGSGLTEIQGKHKTDVTFQVRYKFN